MTRYGDEAVARYVALAQVLADLDRCPHGRHEGDPCTLTGGCGGPSKGNPLLRTGMVVGYGLNSDPIVMPSPEHRSDPDAWRGERS